MSQLFKDSNKKMIRLDKETKKQKKDTTTL